MNDLGLISTQLWELFRSGEVPEELSAGGAMRCPLDARRGIQLRFQPQPPRWLLGVDQSIDTLDADQRARCHEALLRAAHTSRWTAQQVGALDAQGRVSLVDCDFPGSPQQAAALAAADPVEGRLGALLQQLGALCAVADMPAVNASAAVENEVHSWVKA